MIIRFEDPQDERLRDYHSMTDVNLRRALETERGLFMAESFNVIDRALRSGCRPRSFMMSEKWLEKFAPLFEKDPSVPVFVASEDVLEQTTGFHVHRGALAAMHRPELPTVAEVLAGARTVAVFEDIVDHTNLGAMFRSAAALGVDAVLVTPSSADPLYRRSIRVSMGTVFQVPWTRLEAWPHGLDVLREHGFTSYALALEEGSVPLQDAELGPGEKVAFILGTEGHGLKRSTLSRVDGTIIIPMSGGVDSLNVAAASAVVFWQRQAELALA